MNFSLGQVRSDKQLLVKEFSPETQAQDKGKILGLEGLIDLDLDALFYAPELLDETTKSFLSEQVKFFPIYPLEGKNLEGLDTEQAQNFLQKVKASWILQNNIELLENLFQNLQYLKELWPNDRTSFFEELWFLLRNNLGAKNLKIIYNDLKKPEKEGEKEQLVRVKVEGQKLPEPFEAGEIEAQIMENYGDYFTHHFDITEFDPNKEQIVITASINKSPVLIMGYVSELTKFQKALLKSLFDGLNERVLQ